jgi:hypothetical protein
MVWLGDASRGKAWQAWRKGTAPRRFEGPFLNHCYAPGSVVPLLSRTLPLQVVTWFPVHPFA